MASEKAPEKCCVESCEKDAEYFHDLKLPVDEGEYEKKGETDFDGTTDESFDVVKWTGDKEGVTLGFCEEHA